MGGQRYVQSVFITPRSLRVLNAQVHGQAHCLPYYAEGWDPGQSRETSVKTIFSASFSPDSFESQTIRMMLCPSTIEDHHTTVPDNGM